MAANATSWKPGHCPNPGGRPKVAREIRDLAQADAKAVYAKVKAIAEKDGDKQQLAAALAILKAAGVSFAESRAPDEPERQPAPARDMSTDDLERIAAGGQA